VFTSAFKILRKGLTVEREKETKGSPEQEPPVLRGSASKPEVNEKRTEWTVWVRKVTQLELEKVATFLCSNSKILSCLKVEKGGEPFLKHKKGTRHWFHKGGGKTRGGSKSQEEKGRM